MSEEGRLYAFKSRDRGGDFRGAAFAHMEGRGSMAASGKSGSELDALGDRQSILKLNPEVPHGAVHLGVPEEQLDRP